jgi:ribosomal protection tetracycline resistance protein
LTPAIIPMGTVQGLGTGDCSFMPYAIAGTDYSVRLAELLAEHSDSVMAAYVGVDPGLPGRRLRGELAAQTARGTVHPVFFGSALTGAGLDPLMAGIAERRANLTN